LLGPNSEGANDNGSIEDAITKTRQLVISNKAKLESSQRRLDHLKRRIQRDEDLILAVKARLRIQYLRRSLNEIHAEIINCGQEMDHLNEVSSGHPDITALLVLANTLLKDAHAIQQEILEVKQQHQKFMTAYYKVQ